MQWPPDLPTCESRVSSLRPLARLLALHENDGIQPGIVVFDALQIALEQLKRADLLETDLAGQRECRRKCQTSHGNPPHRAVPSGCCHTSVGCRYTES